MIRPDLQKWHQTIDDLRRLSVDAPHRRTRERFLALFMIASGQTNATRWAAQIGRSDEAVMAWVHTYNRSGPDALAYRRSGGIAPLLPPTTSPGSSPPSRPPTPGTMACPVTAGR